MSRAIRPFTIDVPAATLDDLAARLAATRWPDAETVDDWSQGTPLAYARELARYWADEYRWPARQDRLNRFDHFLTELDGLDIHFIHQRSPHPDALPLLITHGWPGSVVEFDAIIEPLVDPVAHGGRAEDAFHVVCPSLPGFGFSAKPREVGWTVERIAEAWAGLMDRLGYSRFGAQGGDWGSAVTTQLGRNGGGCIAIHVNMPMGVPTEEATSDPSPADQRAFAALEHYQKWDSGYSRQQSTRPQSLGYGLVDSPVGQMAWIVEKFWAWTDCDGHPENAIGRDALLDNVMLYWLSASGASSARIYWESFGSFGRGEPVGVPTGVAAFPREIFPVPRSWCEGSYNLIRWTDMERGGHFAAMEQPEALVADLRAFFSAVR